MSTSAASHWTKPATRNSVIDRLVEGVDRYNPQNVELLEDYLYQQVRQGEYDCLANLAILKLLFNHDLYNGDIIVHILVKALTATPAPDFNLCLALLGERSGADQTEEPDPVPVLLPQLQFLYTLLRTCRFPYFWEVYQSDDLAHLRKNYISECAGFQDSIREVVVKCVKGAFTRIGKARLESYLNLKGAAFDSYIAGCGWTTDSKGVVVIPPNPDNQIQAIVIREDIQLPPPLQLVAK
ncbi:hypothetical protein FRB99_001511 [Tulasnella sp. 403]|nr:hypothetical protein FRB99_001511 [Tulasnella sp. 403]